MSPITRSRFALAVLALTATTTSAVDISTIKRNPNMVDNRKNHNNKNKVIKGEGSVRGLISSELCDEACQKTMAEVNANRDPPAEAGDQLPMGAELRFCHKIDFDEDADPANPLFEQGVRDIYFPLTAENYPIDQALCDALAKSNCHSIVMPNDHEVAPYSIKGLVEYVGGIPKHAPDAEFWPQFEEVILYQQRRRACRDPNTGVSHVVMHEDGMPWLNLPKIMQNLTIDELAEAVHDEFPGTNQANLIVELGSQEMKPSDIIPSRCKVQFLHGPVLWSNLNTWAINMVAPKNFAAKYFAGRARPEETAWAVHCSLTKNRNTAQCVDAIKLNLAEIPFHIQTAIDGMALTSMEVFGAYEEGAPMHPSWPAMHSAASCMSMWLPIVADVTDEQLLEIKKMDLAVSMARTVAGVHYYDDNIAGLTMGQHIITEQLPAYLERTYGADPAAVTARLLKYKFDWKTEAPLLMGNHDITTMEPL